MAAIGESSDGARSFITGHPLKKIAGRPDALPYAVTAESLSSPNSFDRYKAGLNQRAPVWPVGGRLPA